MTICEKILDAAQRTFHGEFSCEDLVVACWRLHPQDFTLNGYDHPDSNKVIAALVGCRGVVARGWLLKVAPKTYVIAEAFSTGDLLGRLQASVAWQKFIKQGRNEATYTQAMAFWGCARGDSMAEKHAAIIHHLERSIEDDCEQQLDKKRALLSFHRAMMDRFASRVERMAV